MRALYYKNKFINRLLSFVENRRLFNPLKLAVLTLKDHRLWPAKPIVLDLFSQMGLQWTRIIYHEAAYLEMWDINEEAVRFAAKEFPSARTVAGDSITALKTQGFSRHDFNVVILDHPVPFCYNTSEFDHFNYFQDVLKQIDKECVIIVNVVPDMKAVLRVHPKSEDFIVSWKNARKQFYNTESPEYISPTHMQAKYRSICLSAGYELTYINYLSRNESLGFMFMSVRKK